MSEVSIKAAYGAYKNHRASNSIEDLCISIVKGQGEYGYNITQIYSFINSGNEVLLFYCRDGNHEDFLTSPHVRQRVLLWQDDKSYDPPEYFTKVYSEFTLKEEEIRKKIDFQTIHYVSGQMGMEIQNRLENLGADLSQPTLVRFSFEDIEGNEKKSFEDRLILEGFLTSNVYTKSQTYWINAEKSIIVEVKKISELADDFASFAKMAGGRLDYCFIEPQEANELEKEDKGKKPKNPWWKFKK